MSETLHEAAVRFTGKRGCIGCCSCKLGHGHPCEANDLRDDNGVCLVRRIAQCSNADEQIAFLKQWQFEHPRTPEWVKSGEGFAKCGICGHVFWNIEKVVASADWKYCPSCGVRMERRGDKIAFD